MTSGMKEKNKFFKKRKGRKKKKKNSTNGNRGIFNNVLKNGERKSSNSNVAN